MTELKYIGTWFTKLDFAEGLVILMVLVVAVMARLFFKYIEERDSRAEKVQENFREDREKELDSRDKMTEALNELGTLIKINTEIIKNK